jgi:hypothetical protein
MVIARCDEGRQRTPTRNRTDVCGTGITLPGRADVSQAAAGSCRLQLSTVLGSSGVQVIWIAVYQNCKDFSLCVCFYPSRFLYLLLSPFSVFPSLCFVIAFYCGYSAHAHNLSYPIGLLSPPEMFLFRRFPWTVTIALKTHVFWESKPTPCPVVTSNTFRTSLLPPSSA